MRRDDAPIVAVAAACVLLLLIFVPWLYVGILVYVTFLLILVWSAVRYRREGWGSGILFVLLASFPAWGIVGYWLYCLAMGLES